MARKKKEGQNGGPITPPDFEKAQSIYDNDVQPANKAQKQAMKEAGDGWKEIKKECRVNKGGFHKAQQVAEMEEVEQQAWLRSFKAGLENREVVLHADAVDKMHGINTATVDVIPTGEAAKVEMPSVN